MSNMPTLKFDKSIKYLESQISIQKNNKHLILDIISNIGLILNNSSSSNNEKLQSVLDMANEFLQNISNNITTLEQLNLEISNITADLNEIMSAQAKSTKTKEYYIAAFSNIKTNIVQYTKNFQEVEKKLDIDNHAFNEFIKDNDFKYTVNTVENETENSENTYELASFSINNDSTSISADIETQEANEDDIIDDGVEEAIGVKEESVVVDDDKIDPSLLEDGDPIDPSLLEDDDLIDPSLLEDDDLIDEQPVIEEENVVEEQEVVVDEQPAIEEENVVEEQEVVDEIPVQEENKTEEVEEPTVTEEENKTEEIEEPVIEEKNVVEEQEVVADEQPAIEEENVVEEQEIVDEVPVQEENKTEEVEEPTVVEEQEVVVDEQPTIEEKTIVEETKEFSPVDELANIFKDILIDLSDNKLTENEFKVAITDLKAHLPSYNKSNEKENIVEETSAQEETTDIIDESKTEEQEPIDEVTVQEDNSINEEALLESFLFEESLESDITLDELNEGTTEPEETDVTSIISSENQKRQIANRHNSIEELIKKIERAEEKNKILLISEKTNKIYLPYRITELQNYMEYYPNTYKSLADVVEQEFILDLNTFTKHPAKSRFSETYNLVRNRSGKSILKALSYAVKLRNKSNIDPAVIAACKNEYELHCYLYCIEQNKIDSFKFFNIIYDVNLF